MVTELPPVPSIPILETARLRLRAHTLADFSAYCSLWADPLVVKYIGGKPNTPEEVWSRLLRNAGHWSLLGFGSWLIEEKSTGEFIGESGLFDYHRGIDPPLTSPEISWILAPAAHGKGYATEAVTAVLAWGAHRFTVNEVTSIIDPDNTASLRVAEKCGFEPNRTTIYRESPVLLLTRRLHN